jgi:hypothetical protein
MLLELDKSIVISQMEATLAMLKQCAAACPSEHWKGKIANDSFRFVAYHALFYTDLYLSMSESAFQLRELHRRGGDERGEAASPGLSKEETLGYVPIVRQKLLDILGAETEESLAGPSGFSWRKTTRAELHVYNIRHAQHHVGQLSAYLRRVEKTLTDPKALGWIGQGWR